MNRTCHKVRIVQGHGRGGRTCELNLSKSQNRNLGHGRGRKTCQLNLSQSQNRNLGHGRGRKDM